MLPGSSESVVWPWSRQLLSERVGPVCAGAERNDSYVLKTAGPHTMSDVYAAGDFPSLVKWDRHSTQTHTCTCVRMPLTHSSHINQSNTWRGHTCAHTKSASHLFGVTRFYTLTGRNADRCFWIRYRLEPRAVDHMYSDQIQPWCKNTGPPIHSFLRRQRQKNNSNLQQNRLNLT